jgi:hypothetical protein
MSRPATKIDPGQISTTFRGYAGRKAEPGSEIPALGRKARLAKRKAIRAKTVGPDRTGAKAVSIGMKVLRAIFTGWPALLTFLVSPTLAVWLSPHDAGEWKRWLIVAPVAAAYVWFTWPQDPNEAD